MMYKRRLVPGTRDFPQGCGVFSGHRFSSVESGTMRCQRELPEIKRESSIYSETESSKVEGFDSSWDVVKEELVVESRGCVQDHIKEEVVDESKDTPNQGLSCLSKERMTRSPVKKRRVNVHNSSTMEVQREVSSSSKRRW